MKQISLLLGAIVLLSISACAQKQPAATTSQQPAESEQVQFETFNKILASEQKDSVIYKVRIPASGKLGEQIAEYVSEALGGTYTGSYADVKAMVNHYAQDAFKEQREEKELVDGEGPSYIQTVAVNVPVVTDKFLQVNCDTYVYLGGAHGMNFSKQFNVRLSDGRKLDGQDLLVANFSVDSIQPLIEAGLKHYLESNDQKVDNLRDFLMFDDPSYSGPIPMPQTPVTLTDKGLQFVYQPYEIMAYAAGSPSFVIPTAKIAPYLNVTARKLLGLK